MSHMLKNRKNFWICCFIQIHTRSKLGRFWDNTHPKSKFFGHLKSVCVSLLINQPTDKWNCLQLMIYHFVLYFSFILSSAFNRFVFPSLRSCWLSRPWTPPRTGRRLRRSCLRSTSSMAFTWPFRLCSHCMLRVRRQNSDLKWTDLKSGFTD